MTSKTRSHLDPLERRVLLSAVLVPVASFDGTDGANPFYGLVIDSTDDLFGAASGGGADNGGVIFEVPAGTSSIVPVASFNAVNGTDPTGDLLLDSGGNLFGTAANVFELPAGSSTITQLATFDGSNGSSPMGGVVEDSGGNLFGTTQGGGADGDGTIFEAAKGTNSAVTIASFNGTNGQSPASPLILDSSGNLIGTAPHGGAADDGVVFMLAPGSHTITTIASFNGTDGNTPANGVILVNGNLYGTTAGGGTNNDGTIFEIAAESNSITTLANFNGADGQFPQCQLAADIGGDLFGTTENGGTDNDGAVFELPAGSQTISTVASLNGTAGQAPYNGVVIGPNGTLFGVAERGGGVINDGAVFEVTGVATGGGGSSFATLTDGSLVVNGTAGNDTIALTTTGTTLNATLNGVNSAPFALSSITSIDVEAGAGNDLITLGAGVPASSVQGGPGDDTIMGGPGNDTLGGGQGNDSVLGDGGDDSIKGGAGDDVIGGGQGNDTLFGGPGSDVLRGGQGDDYINGGAGTDYMYGGQGNNTFYAVNGTADQIFAGAATNDSLIYSSSDNPIIESGTIPPGNVTLA